MRNLNPFIVPIGTQTTEGGEASYLETERQKARAALSESPRWSHLYQEDKGEKKEGEAK